MLRSQSGTLPVLQALTAVLCLSFAGCKTVGPMIEHGWNQAKYEGQVLSAKEGRGAERLRVERDFDATIDAWVEQHGVPDYIELHAGDIVEFCYIDQDRVIEFSRPDWRPKSVTRIIEQIPERLSKYFVKEDRERLAALRAPARSPKRALRRRPAAASFPK